jgi:hypothetical protein
MGVYESRLALGDASVTIPAEMAAKAIRLLNNEPDAEALIEMLGLDGIGIGAPKCVKHGVDKVYATSGYYCKVCKSRQEKARRERSKEAREGKV